MREERRGCREEKGRIREKSKWYAGSATWAELGVGGSLVADEQKELLLLGENADWQQAAAYVSLTRLFMRLLIVNLVKTPDERELDTYSSISTGETVVKVFWKLGILVITSLLLLLILWINDLKKLSRSTVSKQCSHRSHFLLVNAVIFAWPTWTWVKSAWGNFSPSCKTPIVWLNFGMTGEGQIFKSQWNWNSSSYFLTYCDTHFFLSATDYQKRKKM